MNIKVMVGGIVTETIQRVMHKGNVCVDGKWYEVKDGAIDFTEGQKRRDNQKLSDGAYREQYKSGYEFNSRMNSIASVNALMVARSRMLQVYTGRRK